MRRIRLTRYAPTLINFNNYGAYRLRIEVTAVEGPDLDENIFVYRKNPPSPYTTLSTDNFEAVAGPPQMADIPAGEPNPDLNWPYYRLNYVELDVASTEQAEAIWLEIQQETCVLIDAMNRLTQLQAIQDVWCPGPPDSSVSVSTSTSV
jgi:hypothetical protein